MSSAQDWIRAFADRYTAAWCSQDPAAVAAHYSPSGSLCINGGKPAVGRVAITEAAKSFMTAIPDMRVILDRLVFQDDLTEYHWTLLGTNTGPGGTGHQVRVSGFERWSMGSDGLIQESQGHFDSALYEHQLAHGVED